MKSWIFHDLDRGLVNVDIELWAVVVGFDSESANHPGSGQGHDWCKTLSSLLQRSPGAHFQPLTFKFNFDLQIISSMVHSLLDGDIMHSDSATYGIQVPESSERYGANLSAIIVMTDCWAGRHLNNGFHRPRLSIQVTGGHLIKTSAQIDFS